uniref:Uncharacterized protein n=1 Tax=Timema genevievae TaxID=629358 RepID=A0A7R9PJG6_TIMGE|nr:unnamed protein product [Timema genevievae]
MEDGEERWIVEAEGVDIRSYFMIGGSKNKKETDKKAQIQDEKTSKPKKKRAIILSSDSEDENPASKRQRDSNALGAACNDVTEECACVDVKSIEKEV